MNTKVTIARLWWVIFALFVLLFFIAYWNQYASVGFDVSVFIGCAQQVLAGQKWCLEVAEINPPLISYLSCIPVLLTQLCGFSVAQSFVVFVVSLIGFSITVSILAIRRATEHQLIVAGTAIISAFSGFYLSVNDFGQREQLFVMLYLPFFLIRWLRVESVDVNRGAALLAGLMAGIGCCIKPFFFLIMLAVEAVVLMCCRKRSVVSPIKCPELTTLGLATTAYIVHFMFWDQAALGYFLNKHIPDVLKYYPYSNATLDKVLVMQSVPFGLPVLIVSILWALKYVRQHSIVAMLLAWIAGSYFVWVLQSKCWPYQGIHVMAGVQMMLAVLSVLTLQSISSIGARFSTLFVRLQVLSVVLLAILCLSAGASIYPKKVSRWVPPQLVALDSWLQTNSAPNQLIAVLCVDERSIEHLLLEHGLKWGWRYAWGYPYLFYEWQGRNAKSDEDRLSLRKNWSDFLATIPQDVSTRKPQLMLMDRQIAAKLQEFGLLEQTLSGYELRNHQSSSTTGEDLSFYVLKAK